MTCSEIFIFSTAGTKTLSIERRTFKEVKDRFVRKEREWKLKAVPQKRAADGGRGGLGEWMEVVPSNH